MRNSIKILKISLMILIISTIASSQVNTERKRLGLEKSGFSGNINLTYSVTMGNSELIELGLAPNLVWRGGRNQVFMLNDLALVTSDDEDIISKGFSHLRYNLDMHQHVVYELFTQAQFDKSQDLEDRYLAGTGLRILYLNNERKLLASGVAGMYEFEELSTGERTEIFRGSFYLSTRISLNDKLQLRNTVYFQPEFGDLDDYRILDEGELSILISESISFVSHIKYRYDSKPPFDIKDYDLSIKNGLKFEF